MFKFVLNLKILKLEDFSYQTELTYKWLHGLSHRLLPTWSWAYIKTGILIPLVEYLKEQGHSLTIHSIKELLHSFQHNWFLSLDFHVTCWKVELYVTENAQRSEHHTKK